jgi:hypothetical protein
MWATHLEGVMGTPRSVPPFGLAASFEGPRVRSGLALYGNEVTG